LTHGENRDARVRAAARDRGLRRIRNATGLVTAASAAGAVVLAGGYAQALPGKTAGSGTAVRPSAPSATGAASTTASTGATQAPRTSAAATTAATTAATSAPALQPPTQAPTTASSSAHATSGGS
jgi:hypothetical protein